MAFTTFVVRSAVTALLLLSLFSVSTAQKRIGELSTLQHDLAGTVFAIDTRTFEVRNFVYDGLGPAAFFWVGNGTTPSADGVAIPVSSGVEPPCGTERLPAFNGATVRVELPAPFTINNIGHLSVWCETAAANFGDVAITDASRADVPEPTGPAVCGNEATSPVQDGSNSSAPKRIGELSTLQHDLAGTVFAIDTRTFEIRNFVYDGLGPAAFFWVGNGTTPSADGFAIPVSSGVEPPCGTERLPAFNGATVRVELPAPFTINNIGHLSVWCETAAANFGDVAITDASRADVPEPTGPAVCGNEATSPVQDGSSSTAPKRIGELSTLQHDLAGTVFAIDTRTFEVRNFVYDGLGPAAFFWVGNGTTPSADGFAIPVSSGVEPPCGTERLPAFNGDTVRVELPAPFTINDIGHLSVWCETAAANFGDVAITDASRADVPEPTGPAVCGNEDTFPVQDGFNCENLNDIYQVRWKVNGANIDFELVGKVKPGYYMGFGVSGLENRTQMVGSDVVIATEGKAGIQAEDYYLSSKGQCANGGGVCSDEVSRPASGNNDVTGVSGTRTKDFLSVSYTRPVAASDPVVDKAFKIGANERTYLTWAMGPFNNDSNIPQIHRGAMAIPTTDVFFEFGRPVKDNCSPFVDEKEEMKIGPWARPTISNVTDITARIGPSGGMHGVAGITAGSSWGIAWYMSPTNTTGQDVLIPAIAVERGKTYTFRVFGGDNATVSAAHHPLYITDDKDGGFATKTPISRGSEKIFAGLDDVVRDSNGSVTAFKPTAMGKLCNIKQKPNVTDVDKIESFEEYYKQLNTTCATEIQLNQAGVLKWTVPDDAPDLLYYQCVTHRDLGYKLVVFDEGKVNETRLRLESGGGPSLNSSGGPSLESGRGPSPESVVGPADCTATFKSKTELFAGCSDITPNFRVLWNLGESTIDTLFVAKTTAGWAGFSWGNSGMVGSNAAIAYKLADGTVGIDDYFLRARQSSAVQPAGNQNLTNPEVEIDGEVIAGRFMRPLSGPGIKTVANNVTSLIWAMGPESSSATALGTHGLRGGATVDLSATGGQKGTASGDSRKALFLAHGAMMGLAWIVFIPLGVIAMRFFKMMNPATFQVHRGLNGLSVIVILIAFIMGVAQGSHTNTRHLGLGVVITLLALWQAVNGALRPHKEAPTRKPWFLAHAYSGRLAVVLAIINVFFGIDLFRQIFGQSPLPIFWRVITGVVVGVLLGLVVALSAFPGKFPVTEQGPLLPHENGGNDAADAAM